MDEAIDGGERHGLVWEDLAPFAEWLIGRRTRGHREPTFFLHQKAHPFDYDLFDVLSQASEIRRRCSALRLLRIAFAESRGADGCVSISHCASASDSATMLVSASPRSHRSVCSIATSCIEVGRPGAPVR